jgi:hypothetical protein
MSILNVNFNNLHGIAVDVAGNVYVNATSSIYKLDIAVTDPFSWANPLGLFII